MHWLYLILAGIFEVVWAILLKDANLQNIPILLIVTVSMALSVIFLAFAARVLPIAIAYAIWTGFGILGTCIYSFIITNKVSVAEVIFIGFVLVGIIGLKLLHTSL